jgi:hypothetical protein
MGAIFLVLKGAHIFPPPFEIGREWGKIRYRRGM